MPCPGVLYLSELNPVLERIQMRAELIGSEIILKPLFGNSFRIGAHS